jgi:hypothetical protein
MFPPLRRFRRTRLSRRAAVVPVLAKFDPAERNRATGGFAAYRHLTEEEGKQIAVAHTMPDHIEPEDTAPTRWAVQLRIPFALLARVTGSSGEIPGARWNGNIYKCADGTSHPHWASWAPVDELNFYLPRYFGEFLFERTR